MATPTLASDHSVPFGHPSKRQFNPSPEDQEPPLPGGALRGIFYAMLFNIFLFLAGTTIWEFWRLIR